MIKGIVIEVRETEPPKTRFKITLEEFEEPYFETLGDVVDGWIEQIGILRNEALGFQLVANEEGRLLGLPYNALASRIANRKIVGHAVLTYVGEDDFELVDEIVYLKVLTWVKNIARSMYVEEVNE